MKQTTDSSLRNALDWWHKFDGEALRQDNLCKKYFPFSQYYNLHDWQIMEIHQQETNPKAIIGSGVDQEYYLGRGDSQQSYIFKTNDETGIKITVESEYYKEDNSYHLKTATDICEAVNNYQSLRDSNTELLEALEEAKSEFEGHWNANDKGSSTNKLIAKLQSAINKAKSI